MTTALDAVLADVARGVGPPNVLLMRFLGECAAPDDGRLALARHRGAAGAGPEGERLDRFAALWDANPRAWTVVRAVLAGAPHHAGPSGPDEELARWAAVFDRLAAMAPEAGVALYALDDPALLEAASQEVAELAARLGLLQPGCAVLDLGCGIGRLAAALAPHVGSVLGLDLSAGMVAEARRRCAGFGHMRFAQTAGRDLAAVPDASVDLVLAADVMPYLVQAGGALAASHVGEFARVLRHGGAALVLNMSYRGDLARDGADLAAYAARSALTVERNGTRDLHLWDAPTFVLRKPLSR